MPTATVPRPVPRRLERARRVLLVGTLAATATLVTAACGSSGTAAVRPGGLTDLLGSTAIPGTAYCESAPPVPEAEGGLRGSTDRASVTWSYVGRAADPLHSRLHLSLDRFPSAGAATTAAEAAVGAERSVLGGDAHSVGSIPNWTGATVVERRFADFTGTSRASFAAVIAIGDVVVRIESLGVPGVLTTTDFADVARPFLDGLVGRSTVHATRACTVGP